MIWLLDLVDDHRAATQYDLLKHGRCIDDLGTEALWWDEAFVILTQQPPATSAVWRALYPDQYDTSGTTQRLDALQSRVELVMVLMAQMQVLMTAEPGKKIPEAQWPTRFEQIVEVPKQESEALSEAQILAEMAEFDRLIGR